MKVLAAVLFLTLGTILVRAEAQTNAVPVTFENEMREIEMQRAALKKQLAEIESQAEADTKHYDAERRAGDKPDEPARTAQIKQQSGQKHILLRKLIALDAQEIRLRRQYKVPAVGQKIRPP